MLDNKKKMILLAIIIFGFFVSKGFSQVGMYGGRGLMRLLSANVITPADIYVNGYFSMYFEKVGPEALEKFYTANLNATVGLSRYFELNLHLVPYQDDQRHILGRAGDSQLGIKYMLPFSGSQFQMGIQGFFKFPTAQVPNVPYEVFSTHQSGWGGRALFTLDFTNTVSSFPFKIYTNVGYFDHDINDTFFSSKIDQMIMGAGAKFSLRSTQIYLEYTGEIFVNSADTVDFNENSTRITTGMRFLGPWKSTIDVVGDFSLAQRNPLKEGSMFHKKYTNWRAWIGVTYRFSLFKYFDKSAKIAQKKKEEERRKLERIKKRRKKASEDIDKMKKMLKKKNPDEK